MPIVTEAVTIARSDAHGLAAVASEVLDEDAFSGAAIVFRSSDPDIAAIVITFVQMAGSYAGQQCDHFATIFRGEPPSGLANLFARHAPCLNDKNDVLTKIWPVGPGLPRAARADCRESRSRRLAYSRLEAARSGRTKVLLWDSQGSHWQAGS